MLLVYMVWIGGGKRLVDYVRVMLMKSITSYVTLAVNVHMYSKLLTFKLGVLIKSQLHRLYGTV